MSKRPSLSARPAAQLAPEAEKWVASRALPAAPAGPTKRLTIDLDADLHKSFKALCAGNGLVMAEEVRTAIENRIKELQG